MPGAAVRAADSHAGAGRSEEALRGLRSRLRIERFGVGEVRVEVYSGLLQPGQYSRGVGERFFGKKAVDFVAQSLLGGGSPTASRCGR